MSGTDTTCKLKEEQRNMTELENYGHKKKSRREENEVQHALELVQAGERERGGLCARALKETTHMHFVSGPMLVRTRKKGGKKRANVERRRNERERASECESKTFG